MIIGKNLLDQVSERAKVSPRLRMNYNFHQSLEDKCHRFLNDVEPGTVVLIHRHRTKGESFVILRGKVRVTTHSEGHRKKVQYGVMLLKKLSDFKVSFVEACKDTIYLMTIALGWITYTTYFYQNGEMIVLLKVFGEGQGRRTKASVTEKMPVVRELRWKHVIHEISGVDYDAVLDAEFGPTGTTKREVYEMRACRAYVSFAIKQARLASGIPVEEFEVKMGLKTGRSNLSNVERRSRVLPLDYLAKVMSSLGMRAVIVRPGLVNWNPISRPIPWSRCWKRLASRCTGGNGKRRYNCLNYNASLQ